MLAVVQRVSSADVKVDGVTVGKIEHGLCILLCAVECDTENDAEILARKISLLRIFNDVNGKMNLSLLDTKGEALVVSQFTLCANVKKGNRPSYEKAAAPDTAKSLYELFLRKLSETGVCSIQAGIFAADMKVSLVNDGPVTISLDTRIWCPQEET